MNEIVQGDIPTVAGVHIEDRELGTVTGLEAYIGVGPLPPPVLDLRRVDAGTIASPLIDMRVLAGLLAVWLATGAYARGDIVEGYHIPPS